MTGTVDRVHPTEPAPRVSVLGVGISVTSLPDALETITNWVERREQRYICVTGVHGVMECQGDPELVRIHNASGLTVPDGRPMLWCGRYAGAREIAQLRGADLTLGVCKLAARRGWSSFFYGGAPGTAERLAQRLQGLCPGLEVAGTHCPPFRDLTPGEDAEVVELINASGAQIVWVGLSTPRQERWMASHMDRLDAPVMAGIGGAFDMLSGLRSQAPRPWRALGLEWLYRLAQEPRRLWRRYLVNNPRFMLEILRRPPTLLRDALRDPRAGPGAEAVSKARRGRGRSASPYG